ncbi:MAG TPA: phage virion morphogenesis protein [Opitutaceae bacterium]|mgnify:FL=1|nr:phage virion morphogenesis protein [Opitutaceae bacterium]
MHQSLRRPPAVTQNSVTVSSDRAYAAIHQRGGEIRPKPGNKALRFTIGGATVFARRVVIPARPFFPFLGDRMTDSAQRKIAGVALAKIRSLTQPQ